MQPTSKESGSAPGPTLVQFSVEEHAQLLRWDEFAAAAATVEYAVEVSVFKYWAPHEQHVRYKHTCVMMSRIGCTFAC